MIRSFMTHPAISLPQKDSRLQRTWEITSPDGSAYSRQSDFAVHSLVALNCVLVNFGYADYRVRHSDIRQSLGLAASTVRRIPDRARAV